MITIRPNQIAATMLLTSLATSAYFFAQGTTSLVAAKLFGIDEPRAGAGRATPPRGGGANPTLNRRTVSAAAILERNIFEPPSLTTDAGVVGSGETTATPPVVIDLDTQNAPPCPADHRMTGAVINPGLPTWSYASLALGQTAAVLYRVGQTFAGKTVHRIDSGFDPDEPLLPGGQHRPRIRAVLLEGSGTYCQITMFAPAAQPGAATQAATPALQAAIPPGSATPPAVVAGADLSPTELEQAITRVSDTQFTVQRAAMERALAQQESIFRSARLIPDESNGSVNGMKIYGVRRSSVLGRLGINNGDVLGSVNGQPVTSADGLLEAYQALGRSGEFSINVVRRGTPMTLTYQVQ